MRKYDQISTVFWFLFGLYIIWEGHSLHIGTVGEPSTGFLIFWSGVVLCGLSLLTFIKTHISVEKEPVKMWEGLKWQKPLLVLIIGFVYTFFFVKLGFLLSTFLLMFFLFKFTGVNKWPKVFIASFLSVFCSWFIFYIWLKVQFPLGFPEKIIIGVLKLRY